MNHLERHGPKTAMGWIGTMVAILAVSLGLAACGGGSGSSSSEATESASTSETGSGSESSITAAEEKIKSYIGGPSPFPVTESLQEVPTGATIAYADCTTGVCGLQWEVLKEAADVMGVHVVRVKAGPDAKSVVTGMESIIALKPDAVVVAGQNLNLWKPQLEQLQDEEVVIVASGVTEAEKYGIEGSLSSENQNKLTGELLASYVVAEMKPEANIVMYQVPELTFSPEIGSVFTKEVEALCPGCSVRTADVGIEELGNTSTATITSDLQANPDTNTVVFSIPELGNGLPAALQAAGINVEILTYAPPPMELQYLKEEKIVAGLGFDIGLNVWVLLDEAARELAGQKLSAREAEGIAVMQFLRPEDITFDPAKGWNAYPDQVEEWEKLWGVGS